MTHRRDSGLLVPARAQRRKRLWLLLSTLVAVALAVALMLVGLRDNIVFFYSPSQVVSGQISPQVRFRMGGLVVADTIVYGVDNRVRFDVGDRVHAVEVHYDGILPDLFRDGQGVVVFGELNDAGIFVARQLLTKHDENYMPAEAVQALKEADIWRGQ